MPLQNPGVPISLANIQTQYGGSNPISLSEYYIGNGLVPTGTTNWNNITLKTAGTPGISLADFYGSPNGLLLSNYTNQLVQYNRNSVVYNQAPALQDTDNGNAFNSGAPFGGGHFQFGGIAWQNMTFANTALTTAPGCTVVFTVAGQMESGNPNQVGIANGTVGSVADGISQVFPFFVYAGNHLLAPSYVSIDYRETSQYVATVVAQYNCSPTAITRVVGTWDSGNYGDTYSTYSATQIIPGHWQIAVTKALASNVTTTISIPPNTFQLTSQFMMRDGHINNDNNNPMTTPSGIGVSIQYADHWYTNAAFQWNFNTGSSTLTASQFTNHNLEQGVMYQFSQGGPGGQGVNVTTANGGVNARGFGIPTINAKTSYLGTGNSQTASISFFPSGGASGSGDGGATIQDYTANANDSVWGWLYGASLTGTPPGNSYWIMASYHPNEASVITSGTMNTWLPLSSTVTFSFTYTGTTVDSLWLDFMIATDASGSNAVSLGGAVLSVANGSSGSSGGGGGCVTTYMMMNSHQTAGDIRLGAIIDGSGYNPDAIVPRKVRANDQMVQPCWRMTTVSGIVLDASDSTPMTMKDGSAKMFGPEMVGELVLVDDQGTIRWEEVKTMEDIGPQTVVRFNVDDQSYFAGLVGNRRIASHNMAVAK